MRADEIMIEMKAQLTVDRETAETCLKLVEMYTNQNPVLVMVQREETGKLKYTFEEFH
ncbi:MAG: hypothetical protein LUI12_01905 [Clostridiales bacterium]|nr:hypothetical protein [Clostridiales bacterium]